MLKNSSIPLTPASEKCKQLMELMEKSKMLPSQMSPTNANAASIEGAPTLQQRMLQYCNINQRQNMGVDIQATSGMSAYGTNNDLDVTTLKQYIDERFIQLEDRINQRLLQMEQRHIEKFDCVLKLLEKLDNK